MLRKVVHLLVVVEDHSDGHDEQNCEEEGAQELPDDVQALQAELARVKEELRKEKLRADAYDTMIDIAEDMFKVPIRKKAGAKR